MKQSMSSFRVLAVGCLAATLAGLLGCKKKAGFADAEMISVPAAQQTAPALGIDPKSLPSTDVLYTAITKYMTANQGRAAKDVNELVEKGFLKPLPPLPPGKRYYLDQRGATLKIVD